MRVSKLFIFALILLLTSTNVFAAQLFDVEDMAGDIRINLPDSGNLFFQFGGTIAAENGVLSEMQANPDHLYNVWSQGSMGFDSAFQQYTIDSFTTTWNEIINPGHQTTFTLNGYTGAATLSFIFTDENQTGTTDIGDYAEIEIILDDAFFFSQFTNDFGMDDLAISGTDTFTQAEAVPVPAAVWLLGSGIIGLVGLRKKLS